MAEKVPNRLPVYLLVFSWVCFYSLVLDSLASGLFQFNLASDFWQVVTDTDVPDPVDGDHHEETFLLPSLEIPGNPNAFSMTLSVNSLQRLSRSISPLLPPPKVFKIE